MEQPQFGDEKFVFLALKPTVGSYGEGCSSGIGQEVRWYHCREQFHKILELGVDGFYFVHNSDAEVNLASFLLTTEEILELNDHSKFNRTNKKFITWVKPSQFWMRCEMRRSLLTILMRCGLEFDCGKNNFESALFSVNYTKETELAVKRFLFGFTKFVKNKGEKTGWVSVFKNQEINFIKRKLVLPDDKKAEETIIGMNSLWT